MKRLKTSIDLENMSLRKPWYFNVKYVLIVTFVLTFVNVFLAHSETLNDNDIDGDDSECI